LPEDADWRHEFISEVVNLPGEFDDRIEAMSQYLDFMDTNPVIRPRPPRESGIAVVLASSIIRRR